MTTSALEYAAPPNGVHSRASAYKVLAFLCAAAAIAYMQRAPMAVSATNIQSALGIDKTQLGVVFSAWSLGYALAQIPSGWLADRWGSRRALTLYAIGWSLLTAAVGLAGGYFSMLILWTAMGVAQAGIFPCSTKGIGQWFPPERRASAVGMLACAMGIGQVIGPALTGVLLAVISWRGVFLLYALPGIAWAVWFLTWMRDPPAPAPAPLSQRRVSTPVFRRLIGSGSLWLLCAQQFFRAAAMIFFMTWFPTYLRDSRGATLVESGLLTALAGGGAVIGSVLGGFASDALLRRTGSRRLSRQGIAVAGMTACALLILLAYFVDNLYLAVAIISAGAFCGTFGGVSGYTVAIELGGTRVATVFSVMNMCGNFGAAAFPIFVGWLVDRTGRWDLVMFVFAGIFLLDAIIWAVLNPKEALFREES